MEQSMKHGPHVMHKRKPEELGAHFEHILVVLLPSPANLNYIFREVSRTGSIGMGLRHKPNILEAVQYLEEAGLIEDISGYTSKKTEKAKG